MGNGSFLPHPIANLKIGASPNTKKCSYAEQTKNRALFKHEGPPFMSHLSIQRTPFRYGEVFESN